MDYREERSLDISSQESKARSNGRRKGSSSQMLQNACELSDIGYDSIVSCALKMWSQVK